MALSDFSKVSLFDIAHSDDTETSGDEGGSTVTDCDSAQTLETGDPKSSDEEDTLDREEELEMNTRKLLLLTSISDYQ